MKIWWNVLITMATEYLQTRKRLLQSKPHDAMRFHVSSSKHLVCAFFCFAFDDRLQVTVVFFVYAPRAVPGQLGQLSADRQQLVHIHCFIVRRPDSAAVLITYVKYDNTRYAYKSRTGFSNLYVSHCRFFISQPHTKTNWYYFIRHHVNINKISQRMFNYSYLLHLLSVVSDRTLGL